MEALLIINSLLVAVCLYFIKDFHTDFKSTAKTVRRLKEKFSELSARMGTRIEGCEKNIKSIDKRVDKIEK